MPIKRGNHVFMKLASIGECDDKGKDVLSFGFKGKMIAEPDCPLSCLVPPLIEQIIRFARYSSVDALKADFADFSAYVSRLETRAPEPTQAVPTNPETEG